MEEVERMGAQEELLEKMTFPQRSGGSGKVPHEHLRRQRGSGEGGHKCRALKHAGVVKKQKGCRRPRAR